MEENQRKEMDMSYFGEPTARIAKMKEDTLECTGTGLCRKSDLYHRSL